MDRIIAWVTNHGHMDIEWYQPLDSFRCWIGEALEMLMELARENGTQSYILDGAFYPLEEALALHPEYEEALRALVRDRRLIVGPFYTQFDEFLNAGETIVENCLYGDRLSRAFGGGMKTGYLPDNFGHPSQLPQILRNFGIDNLLFTRGMPATPQGKKEFRFVGDDGSFLYGVNFAYYATFSIYENNDPLPDIPQILPDSKYRLSDYQMIREISEHRDHEKIARELIRNVRENARYYPSGVVPVFTGCDHCPPQKGILQTLELANSMQDEIEFVFGDADGYSALLRSRFCPDADAFAGNLLGIKTEYLLLGAMSTRTCLKRLHDRCEHILFDYALPAHAAAERLGIAQTETMLDDALRKLLLNSTHDTIHGSSLDTVHIEQEYRCSSIEQNGMWTFHDALERIGRRMAAPGEGRDGSLVVFTPAGVHDAVCEAYLITDGRQVTLFDPRGDRVPCEVLPPEPMEYNANGDPALTPTVSDQVRRIRFAVPGRETIGQYTWALSGPETPVRDEPGREIENEFFRITFDRNTISLYDKEHGTVYDGLNGLIEMADDGDVWDWSEPWTPQKTYTQSDFPTEEVFVSKGSFSSSLTYAFTMLLPEKLENGVRSERLLPSPVRFRVTLYAGLRRADVSMTVRNRSCDHCLRLRLPDAGSEESLLTGGIFTVQHIDPSVYLDGENDATASDREMPFRDFVSFRNRDRGLLTAVRGLYTYEYRDGGIEIPLFRSVGRMTKPNMKGREPGGFASSLPVDGAQCLRELTFAFSYIPLGRDTALSAALGIADGFLRPPLAHTMRHVYDGDLGQAISPVGITKTDNVLVSVFRRAFDGDGAILRVYEALGQPGTVTLTSPLYGRFFLTTMNEDRLTPLETDETGAVSLEIAPHKIVTILMKEG